MPFISCRIEKSYWQRKKDITIQKSPDVVRECSHLWFSPVRHTNFQGSLTGPLPLCNPQGHLFTSSLCHIVFMGETGGPGTLTHSQINWHSCLTTCVRLQCNFTSVHTAAFAQKGVEQVHRRRLPVHAGFSLREADKGLTGKKKQTLMLACLMLPWWSDMMAAVI